MKTAAILLAAALLAMSHVAAAQCDLPRSGPASDPSDRSRFADDAAWYTNNEPIAVHGWRWVKYGLPRTFPPGELAFIGEHEGVPVYAAAGEPVVEVIYVLANGRCEVQPYQAHRSLRVLRAGPAPPSGTAPASLHVTGCPRGAHLYIFPAAELAADPRWRAQLVPGGPRHVGRAWEYQLLLFTATPQPYEVVLAWRGQAWRFRFDAVPGSQAVVHARPPGLRRCEVPVYPVM